MPKKRILVAVLNWGLGHATRSIPVIRALQQNGFEAIIASDGQALELLKKEFPNSLHFDLPAYNIRYSRKGSNLKWKLVIQIPRILKVIQKERALTRCLVKKYNIDGIISDNRFGVLDENLTANVYITHQLNVLSGKTTFLSSYLHRKYISKFNECWVPDIEGEKNLSGKLGQLTKKPENIKYIGPLSRFEKHTVAPLYDFMVLLSGPEPQRTMLETKLLEELKYSPKKILFVRGVLSEEPLAGTNSKMCIKNYLLGEPLQDAINASDCVISRPGYTTLMDLARLEKKAFFIPTPGQNEQEYLAERLEKMGIAPFCEQENFELSQLDRIADFEGLRDFGDNMVFRNLFTLFEGE